MRRCLFTIILLSTWASVYPGGIDKGFKALAIYDYFKARQIFYSSLKSNPSPAGYGLAVIYFRNDNPFHNLDSAFKFISLGQNYFPLLDQRQKLVLKTAYGITDSSLARLHDSICFKAYLRYMKQPDVDKAERYMQLYYSSKQAYRVMCMRDSFVFHRADRKLTAEGFNSYIETYPQSCYLGDARNLLEFAVYMETTADKTDKAYLTYIEKHPHGKYLSYAKEELLNYYIKNKNASGIFSFIKNFGANYPTTLAWNMLLGIEAPHHSKAELEAFLLKYPNYPKRDEIMEEFTFWQTPLLVIKKNDKFGYCDTNGRILIEPVFTEASGFREGYAAVQKNDLYGYINKTGKTKIDFVYTEASDFSENVAIVQKDRKYFLIDYSNKMLSARYDEIADFSEGMAIVKKNNLYGAINLNGQEIVKPVYEMMSDYAEGVAVILKNGKYGFADKQGFVVISPIYDWVSSFKNGQARAQYNKLFGVINKKGDFVIQPTYDQIDEMHQGVYLLVKNNLYGFADSSGCMITEVKYNYQPSYKTSLLTDGKFLRVFTPKKQELLNINGGRYFSEHIFEEASLPVNNFIVAKEKGKCNMYSMAKAGFSKKMLIQAETDSRYWYLLTKKGLAVYDMLLEKNLLTLSANKAMYITGNLFIVENEEGKGLADIFGNPVLSITYDEIRTTPVNNLLYIEKNEKGAYFNISARTFTWKEEGFE